MKKSNKEAGYTVPPAQKTLVPPSTPSTPVGNLAGEESNDTGSQTPRGSAPPDQVIRALLQRMDAALVTMEKRAKIQRNISMDITTGMAVIREAVERVWDECDRLATLRTVPTDRNETVQTDGQKRKRQETGTSPKQSAAFQKVADGEDWKKVASKKKKRTADGGERQTVTRLPDKTKATKTRSGSARGGSTRKSPGGAILVRPAQGVTYADTLKKLKTDVDPEQMKVQIQGCKKTKDGRILLRMRGGTDARRDFQNRIRETLGDGGDVKDLTPGICLEILDLDSVTDVKDVTDALTRETGLREVPKVHIFGPNQQDVCKAVCVVEAGTAQTLLRKGRIKIGWVNCRIKERLTVQRCYKCLGYGHTRTDCKGTDRQKCCWRCGQTDHVGKLCKAKELTCFLCAEAKHKEVAHVPGSGACAVFRAALDAQRKLTTT